MIWRISVSRLGCKQLHTNHVLLKMEPSYNLTKDYKNKHS
ncbi:hypothetical protein X975_09010, partial [Stegodyphus mimosarum]